MCRRSAPKALGVKRGRQLCLFFGLFAIYLLSLLRYIAIKYDDDSSSRYDYYEHNIILWSSNKSKLVIDNDDGDYDSSSSSNKNCCGPWSCSYFDNFEGIGSPLATVNMEYLASDWQKRPGYEYDGVPVLNGTKSNFSLRCRTKKHIQPGSYKLMPYIKADYLKVNVDNKTVYESYTTRNAPKNFVNIDPLQLNNIPPKYEYDIEVTVGVKREERSWIMFSWSRIYPDPLYIENNQQQIDILSDEQKIACATTPVCHGPQVRCKHLVTEGLGPSETPWGLCQDFVSPLAEKKKCLVYSFGIRDIYTAELLYGRYGCEVHAFDCTVDYNEQLGPNVTFHPWCLGSDSSELKLDGKSSEAMRLARNGKFVDFPSIIKLLGHELEELTILKMDCEGCEWDGLDNLIRFMPEFFRRIRTLLLEIHFVSDQVVGSVERLKEIKTMSRVVDSLSDYRTFGYSINSDLSVERFTNPIFYNELYDVGLFVGACCYEFSMVRKDILDNFE